MILSNSFRHYALKAIRFLRPSFRAPVTKRCQRTRSPQPVRPGETGAAPATPSPAAGGSGLQPLLEPLQGRLALLGGDGVPGPLRHQDLQPVAGPLLLVRPLRGGERQL